MKGWILLLSQSLMIVSCSIDDRIKKLENRVKGLEDFSRSNIKGLKEEVEKIKKRLDKCKCISGSRE